MSHIPYLIAMRDTADGTSPLDVEFAISEPGELHIISRAVVTNLTSAYTSLQLMVGTPGNEHEIYFVGNPQIGERAVYDSAKIPVPPGIRLIARLTGLTDGDILTISGIGVFMTVGEVTDAFVLTRGN